MNGSLDDVASKLRSAVASSELPASALRGLDRVLRETKKGAEQVRRWTRQQTSLSHTAINGSGAYFHRWLESGPLTTEQVHTWAPGDQVATSAVPAQRERIARQLQQAVSGYTGRDALVARSTEAALLAVSAALSGAPVAGRGGIVVPRRSSFRLDTGVAVPAMLAAGGAAVLEVGTSEGCEPEDWRGLRSGTVPAAVFDVRWPEAAGQTAVSIPEIEGMLGLSERVRRIGYVPWGTFAVVDERLESASTRLDSTSIADDWVTIVPTQRLMGGPPGALLVGKREALEQISSHPAWFALRADLGTQAVLARTFQEASDDPSWLGKMWSTSVENLQNRCERLATQLVGSERVADVQVGNLPARLSDELQVEIASRQLLLRPAGGQAADWGERLRGESPALLTRVEGDQLVVDLRFVPPQLDEMLATLLG